MMFVRLRMMLALCLTFCLLPVVSFADEAGVLSETELNQWIMMVLQETLNEQPLNAPVGEESKTEEGYAFLYSFATLYYDSPVLSEESVLQSLVIHGKNQQALRGIQVGDSQEALIQTYGWQNTILMGDGIFAPFYVLDQLPNKAYWSWAMHEGDTLHSVQCAIHVKLSENLYTDAGVKYTLQEGKVETIEVYGLKTTITKAQVQSNLNAVKGAQASGSGDGEAFKEQQAVFETAPYTKESEASPFDANDLRFASADFLNLSKEGAIVLWGEATNEEEVMDDSGTVLSTTTREGLTLSYENETLHTLAITSDTYEGPRGIRIGASLEEVLSLFYADGQGRTSNGAALLYGDGKTAPYGAMETLSQTGMQLRYVLDVMQGNEAKTVTLLCHFESSMLTELWIYAW